MTHRKTSHHASDRGVQLSCCYDDWHNPWKHTKCFKRWLILPYVWCGDNHLLKHLVCFYGKTWPHGSVKYLCCTSCYTPSMPMRQGFRLSKSWPTSWYDLKVKSIVTAWDNIAFPGSLSQAFSSMDRVELCLCQHRHQSFKDCNNLIKAKSFQFVYHERLQEITIWNYSFKVHIVPIHPS